ncbi:larval cuticle protein 16/17 [Scaptodrosophila lebanonensis]|uniref:Larval cuticle protein 16/17 n=1 Tax=Drosophila lebanonensis TaxID=7225 RepID=A0A6J2TTL4_DROLE|nr:larval cuticle protein 16/17 [Scaptodrosophila lebanonensis]
MALPLMRLPMLSLLLPLLMQLSVAAIVGHSAQQTTELKPQQQREAKGAASVRLLDRFNHRYPDGSYEYRFELDDGTARYERGYFALIDQVKTLMVVGYYSYRMPDGRYITVFYNADQFGYRQNQSITPQVYPNLPRSIDVPGHSEALSSTSRQQQKESGSYYPATSTPRLETVEKLAKA